MLKRYTTSLPLPDPFLFEYHPPDAFNCTPALEAASVESVIRVHSESEGTCHPAGQIPVCFKSLPPQVVFT